LQKPPLDISEDLANQTLQAMLANKKIKTNSKDNLDDLEEPNPSRVLSSNFGFMGNLPPKIAPTIKSKKVSEQLKDISENLSKEMSIDELKKVLKYSQDISSSATKLIQEQKKMEKCQLIAKQLMEAHNNGSKTVTIDLSESPVSSQGNKSPKRSDQTPVSEIKRTTSQSVNISSKNSFNTFNYAKQSSLSSTDPAPLSQTSFEDFVSQFPSQEIVLSDTEDDDDTILLKQFE